MKNSFFLIVTIGFLLTQVLPIIGLIIPIGTSWNLLIYLGFAILLFPNLLFQRTMIALMVYGAIIFSYYLLGNAYFNPIQAIVSPLLCMFSSLFILEYAIKYDHELKFTKYVVYIILICNVLMAIISIPQLRINPNLIRDVDSTIANKLYFLTTYQTLHGLPLMFAPMVFLVRKMFNYNKLWALIWMSMGIVLFFLLAFANAVMAFFVTILIIVLGFLFQSEQFTRKSIIYMIIVFILGIVLIKPVVILFVIDTAQNLLPDGGATVDRLQEIKTNLLFGETEGDLAMRNELYDQSQTLFWESPIIGTTHPEKISNHSWIWDHLAGLGIVFIVPLIMVFVFHIKQVFQWLKYTKVPYVIGLLALFILLYYKNEFEIGTWLYAFVALPFLCRYTDGIIEKQRNRNKLIKIITG